MRKVHTRYGLDTARRKWRAWLLLSVYVPMMVLASMHVHTEEHSNAPSCIECLNHTPHAGHLSAGHADGHTCLLCQFLTLPALLGTALLYLIPTKRYMRFYERNICYAFRASIRLVPRGPPALFLK